MVIEGYEDCSEGEILEIIQHLEAKVNCFVGTLEFYAKGNAMNMMDDAGFKAREALSKFDV